MSRINKYMAGDCLVKTIHQTQVLSPSSSLDSILLLPSLSFGANAASAPTAPQDSGVSSSHYSGKCAFVCPKSTCFEMVCFNFILEFVNRPKLTLFKTLIVLRLRFFHMFMQLEP